MDTVRCAGCGKEIESGSKTMRVATGKLNESKFAEGKEWGILHVPCFESSVNSPDMALARLRKLAKQSETRRSKDA